MTDYGKWRKITNGVSTEYAEVAEDGHMTVWFYSVWGPIGSVIRDLRPGAECLPIKTKKDKAAVDHRQVLIDMALRSQNALVTAMKAAR